MEAEECTEYDIRMTDKCQRRYNKDARKMDTRLRNIIESELDALRHDPNRGPKLEWNLDGFRSIHIDEFSYRIVYKTDRASCTVTIARIDHRKGVYDELERLQSGR